MQPLRSNLLANGSEFYEISDSYDSSVSGFSGDFEYYGYVNPLGKWIIQRHQISTGAYRYTNGQSSYTTNWAGNSGLSYDYYYKMFGTTP